MERDIDGSEPSHPPVKDASLESSFMEAASKLQSSNPELFANAMQQLYSKFFLLVSKNPQVLCSSTPAEGSSHQHCLMHEKQQQHSKACEQQQKRFTYRKYTLPGEANELEYYQCMICKEQRHENSFSSDHVHMGQKAKIRWYCPICDSFFAVTHRSGHIKNRHSGSSPSSPVISTSKECSSPVKSFYASSTDEAIERRVAMIASATAAAVVSATNQSSSPRREAEFDLVKTEKEEFCCSPPPNKRVCVAYADDQEQTIESVSSSATLSPIDQFSDDTGDDDFDSSAVPLRSSTSFLFPTSFGSTDDLFPSFQ